MHINKIKTMYGLKYAVTDVSFTFDKKGNKVPYTHAVEYVSGERKEPKVAIFPLTDEGLEQARELRKELQKVKK